MLWVYVSLYANNKSTLQAQAVRSKRIHSRDCMHTKKTQAGYNKIFCFLITAAFYLPADCPVSSLTFVSYSVPYTSTHSLSPALNWVFYAHGPVCSLKWCHVMMSLYFILVLNDRRSIPTSETENWAAG